MATTPRTTYKKATPKMAGSAMDAAKARANAGDRAKRAKQAKGARQSMVQKKAATNRKTR